MGALIRMDGPSTTRRSSRPSRTDVPVPGGRGQYLWEVLPALWPPPARITRCGRWVRGAAGGNEFIVVPGQRHVVLLLPRRPRQAAAGALRNYRASAAGRVRWQLNGLALAARAGLAEVLPHRIRIEREPGPGPADLTGYLRAVLGRDLVVSLYVGPPRANRKPVLQALTPAGEMIGFVKVGITPLTRDLVRAEAATLASLGAAPLARLRVPRLLFHGEWHGHQVLVQEAFHGRGWRSGAADLSGAMAELAQVHGVAQLRVADSPYWRDLQSRLRALRQQELAGALAQVLDRVEPAARRVTLTFGSWHGDWTPWNMTTGRGRVLVWDWERFATGVPLGYDAVHYRLHSSIRDGVAGQAAAEAVLTGAAGILAPLGVEQSSAGLVTLLYLVEIGTRYLHDGQAEAGARLGRLDTWLLPVLTRHTQGGYDPTDMTRRIDDS
jgi:Phosphotransferase enzyme family